MPCGTRRGGLNFGSGFAGSGAQSLRASETSHESGAQRQRRMAGEVRDRELLVAQRRHEQHVDVLEDARHLERDLAAQPIGLHEVHRGQKSRLAEQVRPRVLDLHLERAELVVERELLERRRALGEQNRHQRAVRPVGQRDFLQLHAELLHRLHRRAIDVGRRALLHPLRDVADLEARDGRRRVEVEMARHARRVAGVRTGDRLQHEHRVLDRPRHRPELVERPAQRHRAGARHAAERRTQAGHAAPHRGRDDAAAGFAADRKGDERRRGRGAGPGARSRRAFLEQPRVHRLAAEPDVVERERAERELRDEHRAGLVQPAHDRGVRRRHAIAERLGAVGRRDVLRVEQILHAVRDAVQRTAVLAGGDLGVGLLRARERVVPRDRDDRRGSSGRAARCGSR